QSLGALEHFHGQPVVGVDADLGGDLHGLLRDLLGVQILVDERAGGGQGIVPAGADGDDVVVRFKHVAGAGNEQAAVAVGDGHQRLEAAQITVGAPVLGEVDGGPHQLA